MKSAAAVSCLRKALAGLLLLSAPAATLFAQKSGEGERDDPKARAEYLQKKRGGPAPAGARQRALKEVDAMLEREGKAYWDTVNKADTASLTETTGAAPESATAGTPAPISASQWIPIGPQATNPTTASGGVHVAGRVTALAVDPHDATGNTVYLGAAQGGVWKTIDGGMNWTSLTDGQLSLATGSIALDGTTNPSTIYVGTGEDSHGADSYYGVGVLKSVDGGANWTLLGQSTFGPIGPSCIDDFLGCGGSRIGAIAIQPGTGGVNAHLLAGTNAGFSNSPGLKWSTDAGNNWQTVASAGSAAADSVVWVSSTVALVGMHGLGVSTCTASGNSISCAPSNNGINVITGQNANTTRVSLATDNAATVVYAALSTPGSALFGLFKSVNQGLSWSQIPVTNTNGGLFDFCTNQCFYDMLVAVNPLNGNNVLVGGSGNPNVNFLFHSVDGGVSWQKDTGGIHADQHSASFKADGTKMYIGNDGGVYSTTGINANSAVTWTELNNTLNITQFYGYFAIHPGNSQITFGGTQDNGTQKFTGNLAWDEVTCGDGSSAVFDVNDTNIVYANCQDVDIRRSPSGNVSSFGSSNTQGGGISTADNVSFIPPMVGDSGNPMKLYFGTYRLWRATSSTTLSWLPLTGNLTSNQSQESVTTMGISPDSDTAFIGTSDGLVTRVNSLNSTPPGGTAPVDTAVTPPGLPVSTTCSPNFNCTRIGGVSVLDATHAFVAAPGFSAGNHVWMTTNGSTWTNITGNLPNTPANDIVADPDLPNTVYLATDVGVFVTSNISGTNTTWSTLMTGLPKVAVFGLRLHRPSRTLRAATHGRGMWDLNVPACAGGPCIAVSPGGLSFGNQAVGTSSAPQVATIKNIGTQALSVISVSAGGDYTQTNNCTSVPANGTCAITVTFYPRSGGSRTGGITVMSNGGAPAHVGLSGTGTVVQPNDDLSNGMAITSGTFTTSMNTTAATAENTDPNPSAPCTSASSQYFPTDPLGWDPTAGFNHHAVWFNYTPATTGIVSSLDTLTSDYDTVLSMWTGSIGTFSQYNCNDDAAGQSSAPSQMQNFNVSANTTYRILASGFYANSFGNLVLNLAGPAPVVGFDSPGLSFTGLPGHTSGPKSLVMKNNNPTLALTVSSIVVSGDYSQTNNCPASLAANATCTINLTFAPITTGQRNGILTVTDNAAGSPQKLPVIGFAYDLGLGFSRVAANGTVGSGTSTVPGSRTGRPARTAADIIVVAGQSQSMRMEVTSASNSGQVVTFECTGAPRGTRCTVEPAMAILNGQSMPITVRLDTSAVARVRSRRLSADNTAIPTVAAGDYELQVNASVGDAVQSTTVTAEVRRFVSARFNHLSSSHD